MAESADEEARRLDMRIAEIRRKNEAILRRRKEIEEDKKLAEQQNAVVKLRPPSAEDWPRERTPALKPSKRVMAEGTESLNSSFQDTPPSNSGGRRDRPGSSRGRDLMEKGAGPPPDPRSFLFDPDRDSSFDNSRERSERGRNDSEKEFRGSNRGAPSRDRYDQRGGRGGARRGGGGDYGERRRSRGDEAWRSERHKIDEARIERQKDTDGRWRREWDNEKLAFELDGDDNKHPVLTPSKSLATARAPTSMASTPTPSSGRSLGGRLSQWRTTVNKDDERDNTFKRQSRDSDQVQESGFSRISAPKASPDRLANTNSEGSNAIRRPNNFPDAKHESSPIVSRERTILTESENFKIIIRNKESGRKEDDSGIIHRSGKVRNDRRSTKRSGILRTSQSSVSEDDASSSPSSPSKFTQYENMTFTIENKPVSIKRSDLEKMSHEDFAKLSKVSKPPLPNFQASTKKLSQRFVQDKKKADEGDDSWEDVTTSGTESLYESGPESTEGTPLKVSKGTEVVQQQQQQKQQQQHKPQTVTYTPDDFICLVPPEPQSYPNISEYDATNNSSEEASKMEEIIISESILLVPPNSNTEEATSDSSYPDGSVGDVQTGSNHTVNVDNYIVLVKPDKSFEENVQLDNVNAQFGLSHGASFNDFQYLANEEISSGYEVNPSRSTSMPPL